MNKLTIALASTASLALAACAETPPESDTYEEAAAADQMANAEAMAPGTVVEVAQGDETFSTLVSAVTAAGLGETLSLRHAPVSRRRTTCRKSNRSDSSSE